MITTAPNQSTIQIALRGFLLAILPAGIEVVEGQNNRVPEPKDPDFVVFTATRRQRLATNVDGYEDDVFTGGTFGSNVLAISSVKNGSVVPGRQLFGVGVVANTIIGAQQSGDPGGVGLYLMSPPQTFSSRTLAAGVKTVMQETQVVYQIDVHGPSSADNAQIISTLMRDEYATQFFDDLGTGVSPLYADDPKQIAFTNAEQQYEDRWVIEALLQANVVLSVPQQFADSVVIELIDAELPIPPSLDFSRASNSQYVPLVSRF